MRTCRRCSRRCGGRRARPRSPTGTTRRSTGQRFDLALLRSAWDYTERLAGVPRLGGAHGCRARTLLNPAPVVRWNTDKHYLRELTRAGLPVVPSASSSPARMPPRRWSSSWRDAPGRVRGEARSRCRLARHASPRAHRRRRRSSRTCATLLDARPQRAAAALPGRVDRDGETALMFYRRRASATPSARARCCAAGARRRPRRCSPPRTSRRGCRAPTSCGSAERVLAALPFGTPAVRAHRPDPGRAGRSRAARARADRAVAVLRPRAGVRRSGLPRDRVRPAARAPSGRHRHRGLRECRAEIAR